MFFTTTSKVSVAVPPLPSLTLRLRVIVAPVALTCGAVNDGLAVLAPVKVTEGPAVCTHE